MLNLSYLSSPKISFLASYEPDALYNLINSFKKHRLAILNDVKEKCNIKTVSFSLAYIGVCCKEVDMLRSIRQD